MHELPVAIRILDCRSGEQREAALTKLSRHLAATEINGAWWKLEGVTRQAREQEDDHHWVWRKLVGQHRNDLAWEFVAAQTDDGEVQGAMGYRIDLRSLLHPDLTTVYVDRLAVAPRNRPWLVPEPRYKGVGSGLLLRAVCHSYVLGLGGRVSLASLPSERTRGFYERRGFIATGESEDGLVEYELSDEAAQRWLQQEGYL